MIVYWLRIKLLSDTTFGSAQSPSPSGDIKIQLDQLGLPFIQSTTLKSLLAAECQQILLTIYHVRQIHYGRYLQCSERLFGNPNSVNSPNMLRVGNAYLPSDLREAIQQEITLSPSGFTHSHTEILTGFITQTAINQDGTAQLGSLRTTQTILKGTMFESMLEFIMPPEMDDICLLAACVKALRRAGLGRHRGRGHITAEIYDSTGESITKNLLEQFSSTVLSE